MGDRMPKAQEEYIKKIQDDCIERTNMTEEEAYRFAFRCWQLGYMIPTRDMVKQIFDMGSFYTNVRRNLDVFSTGTFPAHSYEESLDFVYRLVVKNERDKECLKCKRLHSGSCIGTINRGREIIDEHNMCSGFVLNEGE